LALRLGVLCSECAATASDRLGVNLPSHRCQMADRRSVQ
jgi:hypothetical protein